MKPIQIEFYGCVVCCMDEFVNIRSHPHQICIQITAAVTPPLFVMDLHFAGAERFSCDVASALLSDIERYPVVVVLSAGISNWILHQTVQNFHVDRLKEAVDLFPAFRRITARLLREILGRTVFDGRDGEQNSALYSEQLPCVVTIEFLIGLGLDDIFTENML